jgi:hypothetical protein
MSLEKIKKLKPAEYTYKGEQYGNTRKKSMGCMAQDLDAIWPENEYVLLRKDTEGKLIVANPDQLIYPLIKAVQELSEKIEELENERRV